MEFQTISSDREFQPYSPNRAHSGTGRNVRHSQQLMEAIGGMAMVAGIIGAVTIGIKSGIAIGVVTLVVLDYGKEKPEMLNSLLATVRKAVNSVKAYFTKTVPQDVQIREETLSRSRRKTGHSDQDDIDHLSRRSFSDERIMELPDDDGDSPSLYSSRVFSSSDSE